MFAFRASENFFTCYIFLLWNYIPAGRKWKKLRSDSKQQGNKSKHDAQSIIQPFKFHVRTPATAARPRIISINNNRSTINVHCFRCSLLPSLLSTMWRISMHAACAYDCFSNVTSWVMAVIKQALRLTSDRSQQSLINRVFSINRENRPSPRV